MKYLFIAAGLSFCFASPSVAADTPSGEALIMPPYPAQTPWKQISSEQKNTIRTTEWRPADRKEGDASDRLLQTKNFGTKSSASQDILMGFGIFKMVCLGGLRINGPIERIEGEYTVAYAQAYCSDLYGTHEDIDDFVKSIRGRDALYSVTRSFRRPTERGVPGVRKFSGDNAQAASDAVMEEQAAVNRYLGEVHLCPAAEPCPVPGSWPVDGKTPQSEVRDKLGKPWAENQNPDGRHVDLYKGEDGLIRTYLFGKDDLLISTAVHEVPRR